MNPRLAIFLLLLIGCGSPNGLPVAKVPEKPIVDFDFQGLRIGDLAPGRMKLKGTHKESFHERIDGTKSSVMYTIIDGRIEGFNFTFEDVEKAIEAYTAKFGEKPVRIDDRAVWSTKGRDFSISLRDGGGWICSQVLLDDSKKSREESVDELSKKL